MPGASRSLLGLLGHGALPGPPASDLDFKGEAKEGSYQDQHAELGQRLECTLDGDRFDDVGCNKKLECKLQSSAQFPTVGMECGFRSPCEVPV